VSIAVDGILNPLVGKRLVAVNERGGADQISVQNYGELSRPPL
jgi:hypothetical protein